MQISFPVHVYMKDDDCDAEPIKLEVADMKLEDDALNIIVYRPDDTE